MTNYEDSAINRYADIILCTGTEQYIYSNALYSRCGQLAIVDMLYACILLSDYEKYSRKIKRRAWGSCSSRAANRSSPRGR